MNVKYPIYLLTIWFSFRVVFLPTYKQYGFEAEINIKIELSLLNLTVNKVGFRDCVRIPLFLASQFVENYEAEVFHAVSAHFCKGGLQAR
jgi:hypothetical protein